MIETLQGLRFLFMLLIFFHHFTWKDTEIFEFGGECDVSFFFILSGFVLSLAYGKKIDDGTFSQKQFVIKQLSKFYPLHILTLTTIIMLDLRIGEDIDTYKVILCILLLQSWIPSNDFNFAFNGVSWFLSDIIFFYLIFPFLYKNLIHSQKRYIALLFATILALYSIICFNIRPELTNSILYVSPATRVIDFIIGLLVYRLYASQRTTLFKSWLYRKSHNAITFMETALIFSVFIAYLLYVYLRPEFRCAAMFWLFIPPFIYFFAAKDKMYGKITELLKSHKMQRFGGATLEFFLIHTIIQRVTKSIFTNTKTDIGFMPMALLCLCMTMLCSLITKKYFTDKINFHIRRLLSKK